MDASWANWIVGALGVYAAAGVLFAIAFVAAGVARVDPGARGTGLGFRLLILPAAAALWPLLARRWLGGQRQPPDEVNAHRKAARR